MYRAKEFAELTGVTVRTLHHYDRLGILSPARSGTNGYRLYGEPELVRLQHITALKFIGLSLQQIKSLLSSTPKRALASELSQVLEMQEQALRRRGEQIKLALGAVQRARTSASDGSVDWNALKQIIEVIEMENNMEFVKSYYTPEQLAELEKRNQQDPGVAERGQQAWAELLPKVEAAANNGVSPESAEAGELAKQWSDLVRAFTGGNREITQNLNKMYADQQNWPTTFKRPWSDAADAFIKQAMKAHSISCA